MSGGMGRPGGALVTGAGGFLGVHLCRALAAAGWEVHALLRPGGSRWRLPALEDLAVRCEADLRDLPALRDLLSRLRPELIVHAAVARHDRDTPLHREVADNVLPTAHLLDAAAEVGYRRLVHLASSLVFGDGPDAPLREDAPLRPTTPYATAKAAATLMALQQARGAGRPVVVVRPFHVYGPWESPRRLVPRAIRAALHGRVLPFTATDPVRDPVFVEDVADACLLAATTPGVEGELFHVGGGRGVGNREIVAAVERAVGRELRLDAGAYPAGPADAAPRVADVSRARRLLGWRPAHDLDAGVAETVAWVRRWEGEIPW